MKAGPCKIVENTLGGLKKKHMERHKPRVKVKTYMEFSNTRQVHTSCKWGCVTLRWHTMLSTDAGIAALVLNSFGVFSHYAGTQKGGGPRVPSYTMVFVEGYECLLDGINASFCVCVCHQIGNLYNSKSSTSSRKSMSQYVSRSLKPKDNGLTK